LPSNVCAPVDSSFAIDRPVESLGRTCQRARAEAGEGGRCVGDGRSRADEHVVEVNGVVGALAGEHFALAVECQLRDDRASVDRLAEHRLGENVVAELVVHEDGRLAALALVGAEPVRDPDHLVLLGGVARLGDGVPDREQALRVVAAVDTDGVRLDDRDPRCRRTGGDECRHCCGENRLLPLEHVLPFGLVGPAAASFRVRAAPWSSAW